MKMGVRLLTLLALLIGVLYSIHILVQDYQAVTAPRFLRLLFKRDLLHNNNKKPNVRWRRILFYDPLQCARYLYCDLGSRPANNSLHGFIFMLTLEPQENDRAALEEFRKAYDYGKIHEDVRCKKKYPLCPFSPDLLIDLIQYLLKTNREP